MFHKSFFLIQKPKTHKPFVKKVIYHNLWLHISHYNLITYCNLQLSPLFATAKPPRDEIQECIQISKPFKLTTKWNNVRNDPRDSDLIRLTYAFHLISLYRWFQRQPHVIYGSFICSDTLIIGSNFCTLSSFPTHSLQITTSLGTTLCWRSPWSWKGSSWLTSELFRWNILVRMTSWFLYYYCKLRSIGDTNVCFFLQIYLWRSRIHQTSLSPVTMDYCCWCTFISNDT